MKLMTTDAPIPLCPFDPGEIVYMTYVDGRTWTIEVVGMEWRPDRIEKYPAGKGVISSIFRPAEWYLTVQETKGRNPFRFIAAASMFRREP